MAYFTLQFQASGPQVDAYVAVSLPREEALKKANVAVPQPVIVKALIDTGATSTCVDPEVIAQLGLQPTGVVPILTPSTGDVPFQTRAFDVRLVIPCGNVVWNVPALPVFESQLKKQGIMALIGRDVLGDCLFVYDGKHKIFSLAF